MLETRSYKRRKRILFAFLLVLITVAVIAFGSSAFALEETGETEEEEILDESQELSELSDLDYNSLVDQVNNEHRLMKKLDAIFSYSEGSLMYTLLSNKSDASPARHARSIVTAIGVVLTLFYGVIHTVQLFKRGDGSPESIMRTMFVMIAGLVVVVFVFDIVEVIENLGTLLYTGVRNAVVGKEYEELKFSYRAYEEIVQETGRPEAKNVFEEIGNWVLDKMSLLGADVIDFFANLSLSIANATTGTFIRTVTSVSLAVTFYAILTGAYGLLFEMVIRKMFMPIAAATVIAEGIRGPGVRFFKNYLGLYVRIAMFFAILYILLYMQGWASDTANIITSRQINSVLGRFGTFICIRMAAKSLMGAAGGLTREIMGG